MAQPADPSHNIPQDLMSHVHLVSSNRYPAMHRPEINDVAKWLLNAPLVARDQAPFFWTYLDKPIDGTILLTWQPLGRLDTNFATDGFVWAGPEQIFKQDLGNGLLLEIYYIKSGYIPGAPTANHARRRFRLVPVPGHPNPPQPDISLFITHYGPAEQGDRLPVAMIPHDQRVASLMQQRAHLMRGGQIRRKEFMLSDRVNWPSLPDLTRQQMGPQPTPRGVPQQMAYPPQATPGPPAKRARHGQGQAQQAPFPGPPPGMEGFIDDEEDTTRGDLFDHLTPREISLSRYQQNHEWMEEILSSAYRFNQITPPDLGLGLKGELASLTEGIFAASGADALANSPDPGFVGRLEPGRAAEFRKRVAEHIEKTNAEMEQMRAEHEEAVSKLKADSAIKIAESELRDVVDGQGPEIWRVEGRVDVSEGEQRRHPTNKKKTADVVAELESKTGLKAEQYPTVKRVQDGGYQEPSPEPPAGPSATELSRQASQNSGVLVAGSDIDMEGSAGGMLDQMNTGTSSTSTPIHHFPTPQGPASNVQSNVPTPAQAPNTQSPAAPSAPVTEAAGDTAMGGTEGNVNNSSNSTDDQAAERGDWVVVPPGGGISPGANASSGDGQPPAPAQTEQPNLSPAPAKPISTAATPAVTEGDANDFSSLGDLDTAGDALANYDTPALDGAAGELGEGLDMDMGMDESAFGDAFHGVDASGTPGEGPEM